MRERRLARLDAVQVERLWRLLREVHQVRGAGLHPKRHFVGVDARQDLRVAGRAQPLAVELADGVVELALGGAA